jgi:hypothetical protein
MSEAPVYPACRIKRKRAAKVEMEERRERILQIIKDAQPIGARGAFYQAQIAGFVEKTESDCEKVQRATVWLREQGLCPFSWITDATRQVRKPRTHTSIAEPLYQTVRAYRRKVWHDQDVYVEIWVEKLGLTGGVYDATSEFDVPLMPARGYSSLAFLYNAAEAIRDNGKPAYIYHLGDWDPSGQDAADNIERRLRQWAPEVPIHFKKLGVTPQQIVDRKLPTRPTKKSDSRSKKWKGGDSVGLDAVHPARLRQLVRDAIERHISPETLSVIAAAEESERHFAMQMVEQFTTLKRAGAL